jgi:hypothetical protein
VTDVVTGGRKKSRPRKKSAKEGQKATQGSTLDPPALGGRDGARPSRENPVEGHGPSWPGVSRAIPWRATVPRGRLKWRAMLCHGRKNNTDVTEHVPPWENPWWAAVPRGRE